MLKIRAFRAIDDEATCLRYMEGHARVLTDYGITNISTNTATWKDNPSVYGIIAEDEDTNVVGGVRIHVTDGIHQLPVEHSVGNQDSKIAELIYSYPLGSTGELCGLWNGRKVAGWGLSIILSRAVIAIASQIDIFSLFTLCAPYTVYMSKPMGFVLQESIGNEGVLIYPVINHMARFFQNPDIDGLHLVDETNRNRILDLRKNPNQTTTEIITKKPVDIIYQLLIPTLIQEKSLFSPMELKK